MEEKTFVLIKPDGVKRGLVGEIISRFEKVGLVIEKMEMINAEKKIIDEHYSEHINKPFFPKLKNYLSSGKIIKMIIKGNNSIQIVRKIVGSTYPIEANPGTIRGDFSTMSFDDGSKSDFGIQNLIHSSDSSKSAEREIKLWFNIK